MSIRKILVIFSKPPYGNVSIVEGIRLATGVTAADIESAVLFIDDGVLALVEGQQPASIGLLPIGGSLEFLTANGIRIHVLKESLIAHNIAETSLQKLEYLQVITLAEMAGLLPQFDAVFSL
jgi:sulfur relay (sulfurtransferase) DsrF/TusC family protein